MKKSENSLEQGYVFAPYILATDCAIISESSSVNVRRRKSINKIFEMNLYIGDEFVPNKLINSRYSTTNINNKFYKSLEIKNPLK